jgi:hypothetical protein
MEARPMSPEWVLVSSLLAFGSMWACWKIGFEAGQNDIIQKYQDYYRSQCAAEDGDEE